MHSGCFQYDSTLSNYLPQMQKLLFGAIFFYESRGCNVSFGAIIGFLSSISTIDGGGGLLLLVFVVPTIGLGRNFVFGCVFFPFFVFHAKFGTTNNHRNGTNDISYWNPFSCYLNDSKKFQKKLSHCRKTLAYLLKIFHLYLSTFENFVDLCFFLGRPNWFSEFSQTTLKTLIWPNFLCRRQIFKKRPKKAFLGFFWKFLTKNRVFRRALSPQN